MPASSPGEADSGERKIPLIHCTMGRLAGTTPSYQPQAQPYFKSRNAGHLLPPG